jgi:hypothetical protein
MAQQPDIGLWPLFLQVARHVTFYVGEVVSLSPSPQIVGQSLRIYDPRRQDGPVIPLGNGQLGTSGAPLPVLTISVSP